MKNFILYLCICMLASWSAGAQLLNITRTTDQYDKLVAEWMANNTAETFENMMNDYVILDTTTYLQAISSFTQSQYIERLNNIVSPIQLPYNDIIHKHLVAYTTTHRSLTSRMLGQSQCYFPMIEEALARHGLPLELKYITIIESALQPTAKSYAGAVGLWQLMLNTGRHYGLEITSMVDQRRDPVKSTEAACLFLKDMYAIYPDWTLVLACYNYGPGNVSKAIARAGGSKNKTLTYWDIYPYLPKQTRDYVPAFIGITYAFHYYKDHNITPVGPSLPVAVDTVMIDRNMHFEQVASTMNIPVELIRILNPQYTQDLIPGNTKPYPLALPLAQLSNFIACQEEIFAKDSIYIEPKYISSVIPVTPAKTGSVYIVKSGDTLSAIAKRNGTTVAKIKQWNNLTSDKLSKGQKLKMNA